jgi:hypothetical protein
MDTTGDNIDPQQFQIFIYNVLEPMVPEQQRRVKYVDQEAFVLWFQAFTHETVDPEFNYETLELLGDRVLKTTFCDYLTQRFPGIKPGSLSVLEDFYMSKLYQQKLSIQLGFGKWIRVRDTEISTNILEDVFESFVGALFRVSNLVEKNGMGYLNCFNLIVYLFNNVDIDPSRTVGRSKTQIKQMFEKMGWDGVFERNETIPGRDGDLVKISILISPQAAQEIAQLGVKLNSPLGFAIAGTKTGAAAAAYDKALQELFRVGMTHEWVQRQKDRRELANPIIRDLVEPAQQLLQRRGLVRMRFVTPRTSVSSRNATVQLIGVNPEGGESLLASTTVPLDNMMEGKRQVLEKFLASRA